MGFGELATTIIMFLAIVIVAGAIAFIITTQLGEVAQSAESSQSFTANKLRTNLVIDHIYYDSAAENVIMYVKNTGFTALNVNAMTIFINDEFFSGNSTSAPATFMQDTKTVNDNLLHTNEVVLFNISTALSSPEQHNARITTQYDTTVTRIFST